MTQTTGPDLNKCGSAAALTQPARQVHHAMLTTFAETGRAPMRRDLERIAADHGAHPASVLAELAGRDLIAFGADGEIRAAYPFSPTPTRIQVTWAGGPVTHAMCAIDALGISAMLGRPVTITAAEPGAGRSITIDADGDRAQWNPRDAVVYAGATSDDCCAADRTCGYINFFTSAQAARQWAAENPAITGAVLDQAQALGQGIAEFGGFSRTGDGTTTRP
jgi:hypothetical protein